MKYEITPADLEGASVPEYDEHNSCSLCGSTVARTQQAIRTHHVWHIVVWSQGASLIRTFKDLDQHVPADAVRAVADEIEEHTPDGAGAYYAAKLRTITDRP